MEITNSPATILSRPSWMAATTQGTSRCWGFLNPLHACRGRWFRCCTFGIGNAGMGNAVYENRCCVISIKYGYYSDQHYNLKRKIKFDLDFLIHDLISITLHDFEVKKLRKRIIASLKNLGIQESQFYIECSKNQCINQVKNYQETRERLLNLKSFEDFI